MFRLLIASLATLLLAACTSFPRDPARDGTATDGLTAEAVFDRMLAAHGGDLRRHSGDVNLSTDGRWYRAIQRIQPIVTDTRFRIRSEERYRPADGLYAVLHEGPGGRKLVVRTPDGLDVRYNGAAASDDDRLAATALTNDAFRMFHFGPTFFLDRTAAMRRLPDAREDGRRYRRLLLTLRPGFGRSPEDEAILWVDADSSRLYRVHQTLEGFRTTRGAHVDTTFLEYRQVGGYLFPVRFLERVRGPLRIRAHEWWVTGLDLDRGWRAADVSSPTGFEGRAAAAAQPFAR